ncbi:hypothetical protein [Pseudobdellovibrio sp. HCB154]|uniref:hypothetical protein n=1 Tax=Pseudobdellovibrio sp. HCB154 TaxID=3386277 RepID=UPI003916F141
MKLLLSLVLVAFISSCSYLGLRSPSSTTKKHYIITMHGVRGNAESYGEFHQFVGDTLKQIDPAYEYVLFNWTYPVGAAVNDKEKGIDWEPHLIADKFNKDFILGNDGKDALIPELGPEDKISILAYSMGGQMAMTWYYDSMFNFKFHPSMAYNAEDAAKVQSYVARVENVVGLGPVYWGSVDAELGWSFLENGSLAEIHKVLPKAKAFCDDQAIHGITQGKGFWSNLYEGAKEKVWGDDKKVYTQKEMNDRAVRNALIATCASVNSVANNIIVKNVQSVPSMVVSGLTKVMKSVGNVNPSEMNHMRLTSDVINELRVNRISHLMLDQYRTKYRARWTSIVGVFPCLGKSDAGLTCNGFQSEEYRKVNEQLVTIFSGNKRRETDGPVFSPGATADFLYYVETPGNEAKPVAESSYVNTADLQRSINIPSREIFVENMHATVLPAIDGLSGILAPVGDALAGGLSKFDKSLGVDVVIMNKECIKPETCKHPNFKHVIETLTNCEAGRIACNQRLVNKYFGVELDSDRYNENEKLRSEMGSYVLVMNIRLPKSYKGDLSSPEKILKNITFGYNTGKHQGSDKARLENRLDNPGDLYANQIARSKEIMNSYAIVKEYNDSRVVRLFFLGRAWPKDSNSAQARAQLNDGVPVRMAIKFPGLTPRNVTAKVRPSYSTYTDIYIK